MTDEKPARKSKKEEINPFSFKSFLDSAKDVKPPDLTNEIFKREITLPQPKKISLFEDELSASFDLPEVDFVDKMSPKDDDDDDDDDEQLNNGINEEIKVKQKIIEQQNKRILKLEIKLNELINKEETENKTLELVVQQVEKNLLKTTERAVKSEKQCEALSSELVELKKKLKIANQENLILKSSLFTNSQDFKESLNETVCKLNSAADIAEKSLHDLLGGVGTLRLISSCLESLGKIKEAN
jgi:transcriptional regulator NrdR family protein